MNLRYQTFKNKLFLPNSDRPNLKSSIFSIVNIRIPSWIPKNKRLIKSRTPFVNIEGKISIQQVFYKVYVMIILIQTLIHCYVY